MKTGEHKMEYKNITLTELEQKVALACIEGTDGTNSASYDWLNPTDFGLNKQSLKGVFGSLVKKGLMTHSGYDDIEFNVYYWTVNVESDEYGRTINDIDDLLKHFEHCTLNWKSYRAYLEAQ
tara:strand:+ start:94 stop:459 length:366 start_codon:yes stop_codon:yes gene_type:complete